MEGIKAVPRNAQTAAKQKVDDLVEYIKSIPDIIADAAKVRSFAIVVVGGDGGGVGGGDVSGSVVVVLALVLARVSVSYTHLTLPTIYSV